MLTPAFRRHQVTYDVWQAADEVRRDELFQRFVGDNGRRAVAAPSVVTSADGVTAVPVTPRTARKPGQRSRPRATRAKSTRPTRGRRMDVE